MLVVAVLIAAQASARSQPLPFREAVDICRRVIQFTEPTFDAYVSDPPRVECFGTALANFRFRECLAKLRLFDQP